MHREVSRMFDGFFRGIGEPLLGSGQLGWPHVDVRETDSQFKVCAERRGSGDGWCWIPQARAVRVSWSRSASNSIKIETGSPLWFD
jgi:hypothetical protein